SRVEDREPAEAGSVAGNFLRGAWVWLPASVIVAHGHGHFFGEAWLLLAVVGNIGNADDAHQVLVLRIVEHYKALHFLLAHIAQHFPHIIILKAVEHFLGFHGADAIVRRLSIRKHPNCQIAIGDHADQSVVLGDWYKAGI